MGISCSLERPITFIQSLFKSFYVKYFITCQFVIMKQTYFPIFLCFLLFLTLLLANQKGTREFRKSYVEEFYPRWDTLRAQSAVFINNFFFKEKIGNVSTSSCSVVCFALESKDAGVILLKMVFAVLDHFMAFQKNNQPLQIQRVMWIQEVVTF